MEFFALLLVFGLFVGAVLFLAVFSRINSLSLRIEQIEYALITLKSQKTVEKPITETQLNRRMVYVQSSAPEPSPPPPIPQEPVSSQSVPPKAPEHVDPVVQPQRRRDEPPPLPELEIEPETEVEEPAHSRTRAEWESFVGGKILNRIGALALIMGIGFFLKYAIDNGWISETIRVLIGGATGISLIAAGTVMRRRDFAVFAQGLAGAGLGVLYLTVFAAFNYYHLVSQPVAFALMSVVTVAAFQQAMLYDSFAVALLGAVAGFLTPIMLSTGQANEVGLFSYLALLDIGLVAITVRKRVWVILEFLALVGTTLMYLAWYVREYHESQLVTTSIFLTIFWLIFFVRETYRGVAEPNDELADRMQGLHIVTGIINIASYYLWMYQILYLTHETAAAVVALILSGIYGGTVALAMRRDDRELVYRQAISAGILLVFATLIHFTGFTVAIVLAGEATILIWFGHKTQNNFAWQIGLPILGLAIGKFLVVHEVWGYDPGSGTMPLLHARNGAGLILILSLEFALLQFANSMTRRVQVEQVLQWGALLLGVLLMHVELSDLFARLFASAGSSEIHEIFDFRRRLAFAFLWAGMGGVFLECIPFLKRLSRVPFIVLGSTLLAIGIFACCVAGVVYSPQAVFVPLLNMRVLAFVLIAAIALRTGFRTWPEALQLTGRSFTMFAHAAFVMIIVLLHGELFDFFRNLSVHAATADDRQLIDYRTIMTLCMLWGGLAVALFELLPLGERIGRKPLLVLGTIFTVAGVGVTAFSGAQFSPLSQFNLLFNYRALTFVLVIASLAWLSKNRAPELSTGPFKPLPDLCRGAIAILVFVFLTAETRDYFEKVLAQYRFAGMPFSNIETVENKEQLAISAVWLAYSISALVTGIARRLRNLRLFGLGLFGITILKIFLYDLTFLQTLYRIFSFIGLGVILLLVSYLYQRYKDIMLGE